MKIQRLKICGLAAAFALTVCLSLAGIAFAAGDNDTMTQNIGGVVFSTEDFTATEDYAAFVDAAKNIGGEVKLFDARKEQKVRLDDGKSGLLLTTKKTGNAADGASFWFADKMKGDFDIDFRVFSQETYVGKTALFETDEHGSRTSSALDDAFNPFADVRTLSFTFTSVSDTSKSFTVYIDSHGMYESMMPSARAYIEGETFRAYSGGALRERKGYGVSVTERDYTKDGRQYVDRATNNTELAGTSFVNVAVSKASGGKFEPESFSNRLHFDPQTMCVYADTFSLDLFNTTENNWTYKNNIAQYKSFESGYPEMRLLIRNLRTNNTKADDSGVTVFDGGQGLKTLAPEDFAAGYTVRVCMEDITADDTELYAVTSDATENESDVYRMWENGKGTYAPFTEKCGDAYARTGKMIIYSVNGQSMRVNRGFTKETLSYTFPNTDANTPYKAAQVSGYRFTAREKNTQAEGNTFAIDPTEFISGNVFEMAIGAMTKTPAPKASNNLKGGDLGWHGYVADGMGSKMYEYDPYCDVRELGVTFRSKRDVSKAFTVYISSRNVLNNAVSVRVGVEGEDVRTYNGGLKGYSNMDGADAGSQNTVNGTMGNFVNKAADSSNAATNPYTAIKFDASTMTVYAYGNAWKACRKVSDTIRVDSTDLGIALAAADFANGYDVTVSVERMNRKENLGLSKIYKPDTATSYATGYDAASDGVHVLENGYDRACIIDVIKYNGDKTVGEDKVSAFEGETPYDGGRKYLDLGDTAIVAYEGTPLELTARAIGLGKVESIASLAVTAPSGAQQTLAVTDGKTQFAPEENGVYTFAAGQISATLTVICRPPRISWSAGVKSLETVVEGGKFTVDASDVTIAGEGETRCDITVTQNGLPYTHAAAVAPPVGAYAITYVVTAQNGAAATLTRTVLVVPKDKVAPKIVWADKPVCLARGSAYTVSGVAAIDDFDESVAVTIESVEFTENGGAKQTLAVTNGSVALPDKEGVLAVRVSATDAAGNRAQRTFSLWVANIA